MVGRSRGRSSVSGRQVHGDDIALFEDDSRSDEIATVYTLRQQMPRALNSGKSNPALSDFIAPQGAGVPDYLGGFCVTAGPEIEERAQAFEADGDMYSAILVKALADRLAEAFAERMHERVRANSGDMHRANPSRTPS